MSISHRKVQTILREEDIEGYIELGAPGDEYSSEAEEVANALAMLADDEITAANILAVVSLIWARSFNLSRQDIERRMPALRQVAHRLLLEA